MTSSIDFGVISDTDKTDSQIIQRDRELEQEWEKRNDEIRKRELKEDEDSVLKAYRASHFFCGKTVIPLKFEAEIIKHKSECSKCSSEIEERKAQKQNWVAALAEMRGILFNIEEGKVTIENQKRIIQKESKEKLQGWNTVLEMAESKIKEAQNVIEREQIHKHRMLNPDLNNLPESISQAVIDMYMQYEKLPAEKKKHFENYISHKSFSE